MGFPALPLHLWLRSHLRGVGQRACVRSLPPWAGLHERVGGGEPRTSSGAEHGDEPHASLGGWAEVARRSHLDAEGGGSQGLGGRSVRCADTPERLAQTSPSLASLGPELNIVVE